MSTVKANTYQDASGGSNAVFSGVASPPNGMGFRNRIINGDCRVDQRNAGASVSVSTSGVYVLDRWKNRANGGGVFSVQQSSTAPAGFTNSTVYTVTTADASIAAGDNYWIIQEIEGYNVADLGFGTANAQTITLSFWVRSSVTGTYSVFLSNGTTYDRGYVATFTISSANTFEYKTITIAGDTSGTWGKTNGGGLTVGFNLGAGTTYQTTAGAWAAGFFQGTSATTQWIATNGATFYITGVQLEAGTVASPFERRDYGRELMMCQRYYYRVKPEVTSIPFCVAYNDSTTESRGTVPFPVTMRTRPTALEQSGTAADYYINAASGAGNCTSVPSHYPSSVYAATFVFTKTSITAGQGALLMTSAGSGANAYLAWSAEL